MGRSPLILTFILVMLLGTGGMYFNIPGEGRIWPGTTAHGSPYPPDTGYGRGDIPVLVRTAIDEARQGLGTIATIPGEERTVENTLVRFDEIMTSFDDTTCIFPLIADEYQDVEVAAEARNATGARDAFVNEVFLRPDLSNALSSVHPRDEQEQALHGRYLKSFRLAGLPDTVKKNLTILGGHLAGLERSYLAHQREGSAASNLDLMNRIIADRQEMVSLLGYPSFADYQVSRSGWPAGRPALEQALHAISAPLIRLSHEEAADLLEIKQLTEPDAAVVYDYEIVPLRSGLPGSPSSSYSDEVSGYFPAGPVIARINQVLAHIFGIEMTRESRFPGFAPDISLFRIRDPGTCTTLAWFYLGIRSEEGAGSPSGKTYYLRAGREEHGQRIPAVSAAIITVPRTEPQDQILFSPVELQILFHEYGHVFSHSLSLSRYGTLSSGAGERTGYNEIPSHLFEQFLWTPEVLDLVAGTGDDEKIPGPVRDRIIAGRGEEARWGPGYIRVYAVFLSCIDLILHAGGTNADFSNLYSVMYENLTGYRSSSGGAPLLMNPAFFISGNGGIYWHYVLADAYAAALFERFRDEGILNQSTGISYRKEIFEPAGTEEPTKGISDFLGYDPGRGWYDRSS
jgi:Zn-dependent oligopeptidase